MPGKIDALHSLVDHTSTVFAGNGRHDRYYKKDILSEQHLRKAFGLGR